MILIVGAGNMAQEYAKVLKSMNKDFTVVGRSQDSADKFKAETGVEALSGGLDNFCKTSVISDYESAIVTTGVEQLALTTTLLIKKGIKLVLTEKPAGLNLEEIEALSSIASEYNAKVFVAYNRRFYESVLTAKNIIEQDGGVKSFNFELTEWGHVISQITKAPGVKDNWFLANTTHVVDLAFF